MPSSSGTLSIPGYDQVAALPREWGPVRIPEAYQDENGHMNVRHYFDLGVAAIGVVVERMGVTEEYRDGRGQGFFTAEHHIRYHAETHVGDEVSVHFRGIERSAKVLHAVALLVNDTTARLVAALEVVAVHVDLRTRGVVPFPPDLAASIDRELAATATLDWPAPVCGAMGVRR